MALTRKDGYQQLPEEADDAQPKEGATSNTNNALAKSTSSATAAASSSSESKTPAGHASPSSNIPESNNYVELPSHPQPSVNTAHVQRRAEEIHKLTQDRALIKATLQAVIGALDEKIAEHAAVIDNKSRIILRKFFNDNTRLTTEVESKLKNLGQPAVEVKVENTSSTDEKENLAKKQEAVRTKFLEDMKVIDQICSTYFSDQKITAAPNHTTRTDQGSASDEKDAKDSKDAKESKGSTDSKNSEQKQETTRKELEIQLKALRALRKDLLDALEEHEIKNFPAAYRREVGLAIAGLGTEPIYTYPFIYDMLLNGMGLILIQLGGIKDPDVLNAVMNTLVGPVLAGVLIANVLGYSPTGEAKKYVRQGYDNPNETHSALMKRRPILASFMMLHFAIGAFLEAMQLNRRADGDALLIMKYLVTPLILVFGSKYYLNFQGTKTLKNDLSALSQFAGFMLNHLCKLELREFMGDFWIGLWALGGTVQRMANFALGGLGLSEQMFKGSVIGDPVPDSWNYGTAAVAAGLTAQPALVRTMSYLKRFMPEDDKFDPQSDYGKAKAKFVNRTAYEKFKYEMKNLFLITPGTCVMAWGIWSSAIFFREATNQPDWFSKATGAGISCLGGSFALYQSYRVATEREEIVRLANEAQKVRDVEEDSTKLVPNYLAELVSAVVVSFDQASRALSGTIAGATLIEGDHFTGDLATLLNAPVIGAEILTALAFINLLLSTSGSQMLRENAAETLVQYKPWLFGTTVSKPVKLSIKDKPSNDPALKVGTKEEAKADTKAAGDNKDNKGSKDVKSATKSSSSTATPTMFKPALDLDEDGDPVEEQRSCFRRFFCGRKK